MVICRKDAVQWLTQSLVKGSHGGGLLRAKHQVRLKVVMEMEGQRLPRRVGEAPLPPTFRPTLS